MAILRLIAQGVGPFESLDIDFSDGNGKPHLGPHILAGVNGSGKSTVLRTIAWVMDQGRRGFKYDDWQQSLKGYPHSRALMILDGEGARRRVLACCKGPTMDLEWIRRTVEKTGLTDMVRVFPGLVEPGPAQINSNRYSLWVRLPPDDEDAEASARVQVVAYSPSKALRYLENPDLTQRLENAHENCLRFESTVQNDLVQAWLLSVYSKRAIARERKQPSDEYTRSLGRFENALQLIYDQNVRFDVEIEPVFQPCLNLLGSNLNFSQLPDGVRSTVAWIADFMMRRDLIQWSPSLDGKRPGILLLDEVDAHLHPLWQRRLLPAMREALPDVQIIVTSHSPFVISSCPGSRVHVLEVEERGHARSRPPVDCPIGESVTTTLKEIFGVDSRFDVLTERQLNEWNELKRSESAGKLSAEETRRLVRLTEILSERSEELKSIVASPRTIPASAAAALLTAKPKNGRGKRDKAVLH